MKQLLLSFTFVLWVFALSAQNVYTIKADSVKLTNANCDSTELIIENHTQGISGFLYNTGHGRTVFKRGLLKLNDSLYLIGGDSLKYNAWVQGGNRFGGTGLLGTLDNNHLDVYTAGIRQLRLTNTGKFLFGTITDNGNDLLQVNGSIYGNFYTNIPTVLPHLSGAIRLRWGTGDGAYMGFYFQGRNNQRSFIGTPSDTRNLIIRDSVGVSFYTTPLVNIGSEFGLDNNAKLSIYNPFHSVLDGFNVGHGITDTTTVYDFRVKASGNTIIGNGADNGYKLQVMGTGGIYLNPNLSLPGDRIILGGALNTGDGQESILSGSSDSGRTQYSIMVARTGNIGLGSGAAQHWNVGNPTLRINAGTGYVSIGSQFFFFGNPGGPVNCSSLYSYVSNTNEWNSGSGNYPSGQNYYYFGTILASPETGNKRATLRIGADELHFRTGPINGPTGDVEAGMFSEVGNLILGSTTDNGRGKLQVKGNITGTDSLCLGTSIPAAQLHTTGTVRFAGLTSDTTKTRVIVSDASGNLFYRDASTLAMSGLLNSSLATSDTLRSSLAVNGTISAQRLKLSQNGWPDYVFDSSYRLLSLDQLEKYIRQHNHLPGIADAKEVESKGIDVGDHQAALLKKIEELTLYVIEQDKKLQIQSEQIDMLKRKNEELDSLKREMNELRKMITDKSGK